jgi:tetratricopeptide (TPR) repeat protein
MLMFPEEMPTRSPRALRSFVHARSAFRSYLGTRRGQDLQTAKDGFSQAESADPSFSLATFYVAVTANELREHQVAISKLQALASRRVPFLPEVHLQLAYAYTKTYLDENYKTAETALDNAKAAASATRRDEFLPLVEASRVFLRSVMGAYGPDDSRDEHLREAVALGTKLLASREVSRTREPRAVRHEIYNSLGIAHMRQGERAKEPADKRSLWEQAERDFEQALELGPNAVRVLQNRGTLHRLEGDYLAAVNQLDRANESYRAALAQFLRSVEINALDQFPHFWLSILSARLGAWEDAARHCENGKKQQGSVKVDRWSRLEEAIRKQDPSLLPKS